MLKHIAIIADGNRRWAELQDLPIEFGYTQGLITIENLCTWALENNISYLTVYCFSTENWRRSANEVNMLMALGREYLFRKNWYVNKNIHVKFYGRKDRMQPDLVQSQNEMEEATQNCSGLYLTICFDHGGRDDIITAIQHGIQTEEDMDAYMTQFFPNPDIILRTGGEYRLSNFLLWQSAYSELFFIKDLFPDLNDTIMNQIVQEFNHRKRNFGG